MVVLDRGGGAFNVRWIQLDVLAGTAVGRRVLTSGGLDIESADFRSESLLLSALRPRGVLSSSSLLTTIIPDNSDFAAPRVACTSRPSHDSGTVSLSHSSSSCDGTGGFDKARRNMLCGASNTATLRVMVEQEYRLVCVVGGGSGFDPHLPMRLVVKVAFVMLVRIGVTLSSRSCQCKESERD